MVHLLCPQIISFFLFLPGSAKQIIQVLRISTLPSIRHPPIRTASALLWLIYSNLLLLIPAFLICLITLKPNYVHIAQNVCPWTRTSLPWTCTPLIHSTISMSLSSHLITDNPMFPPGFFQNSFMGGTKNHPLHWISEGRLLPIPPSSKMKHLPIPLNIVNILICTLLLSVLMNLHWSLMPFEHFCLSSSQPQSAISCIYKLLTSFCHNDFKQ